MGSDTLSRITLPPWLSYERLAERQTASDTSSSDAEDVQDRQLFLAENEGFEGQDASRMEKAALYHELGDSQSGVRSAGRGRRKFMPLLALIGVCSLLLLFSLGHTRLVTVNTYTGSEIAKVDLDSIMNGSFTPQLESIQWLPAAGDGVYYSKEADYSIYLTDLSKNGTSLLVKGTDILDEYSIQIMWSSFSLSSDMNYMLVQADRVKLWRHSSHANFYIHDIKAKTTVSLRSVDEPPRTSIAHWSTTGHAIAYVADNDLYIQDSATSDQSDPIRITSSGSDVFFNGVPDWVYEEEVFKEDSAVWWSPSGARIAFASFNESDVPEFSFPVYSANHWISVVEPYPQSVTMRYPKPGYPNPIASLSVFDLACYRESSQLQLDGSSRVASCTKSLLAADPFEEALLTEVVWIDNANLLVKHTDRFAQHVRISHFTFEQTVGSSIVGRTVRETDFAAVDGGWSEPDQSMRPIRTAAPADMSASDLEALPNGYVDVVPDDKGFRQIAYFESADTSTPIFLTDEEYEVAETISAIDVRSKKIYYILAKPSTERHLYSVDLPTSISAVRSKPVPIRSQPAGYASVNFSPFGGYYLHTELGGHGDGFLPTQVLYSTSNDSFNTEIYDGAELAETLNRYELPTHKVSTLRLGSQELNVREIRPRLFDESGRTKYPVLFSQYSGPNSQEVSTKYGRDWLDHLVSEHDMVIVTVDGRGTGFKGRKFRSVVRGNLGELERQDQIAAAKHYASLKWVDEKRLGIWGWSFGGYTTCKVLEADAGVFSLGMAVAPVTDWSFYDSIYTERYMGSRHENIAGYHNASISHMDGFRNSSFFLAAGTADDNVHFLNTASLVDKLTQAQVRGWRFRMFTDSDHSISTRGGRRELYEEMIAFLVEKWGKARARADVDVS